MRLPFGLQLLRKKAAVPTADASLASLSQPYGSIRGWFPIVRESFTGAWQQNVLAGPPDVMAYSTVWACVTLIASDIAKLCVELMQEDADGILNEVESPSFSPVLYKPNHYQTRIQYWESYFLSKLTRGNTYALLERNHRGGENSGNVIGMYVLDPSRVSVLVAPDGSVFYELSQDFLSGVEVGSIRVPASEIIHDRWNCLYHPLVGLPPLYACNSAAIQAIQIEQNSTRLFANGSQPGGILTTPHYISNDTAQRAMEWWEANFAGPQNVGKVAALGDGLTYSPMMMTAVDSEIIKQLNLSDERICRAFHVPGYMVGVGPMPNYNNIEALNQQYYSQGLQILIESAELCLDEGIGLVNAGYECEFDLDGLLRMDSATKMTSVTAGIKGMVYTPNEGRAKFNQKPLDGGDTVFGQEQDHSIEWLRLRDQMAPVAPPVAAATQPGPSDMPQKSADEEMALAMLSFKAGLIQRGLPVPSTKVA